MCDANDLKPWIPALAGRRILVIGDVMLDEYVVGRATRISREAPIPVLEFESRRYIPGGAANPSANIVALGSQARQVGIIGADSAGTTLRQVLQAQRIDTDGLVIDAARPTTVKMRIMAQMGLRFPQQVARLDTVCRDAIPPAAEDQIRAFVAASQPQVDAVLLSDYRSGLLTPALVDAIGQLSRAAGLPLTADAQGELDKYAGFTLVKCNANEARAYLGRDLRSDDDFAGAAQELRRRLQLRGAMVITRGADGATAAHADGHLHCPAPAVSDVYDVVGAGDTTIAVLTLALAGGVPLAAALALANYASGLVVRRVGNYAPTPDELAAALDHWR